jgi:hypothetical protein
MFEARQGTLALRALSWNAAAPALLVAAALFSAAPASAQITKINTADLLTTFIRGVDVASDTSGGALVVSAQDAVLAHCITADGVAIRSVTLKPASGGKPFGAFPRARYNAATAQYLVVWPEEQVSGALLKGRTLSCATGALGVERIIGATAWLESGAALDWSATSGLYLVAWKAFPSTLLQVQLVAPDGTPVGAPVVVSAGFGRDPGVAWNPATNEFGVSYSGENSGGSYSVFVVVPAANPLAFRRTTFNPVTGGLTTITDLAFNPETQHYMMTWFELSSGSYARVAEIDAAGGVIAQGIASTTLGSYDSLSIGYNQSSRTFALVGVDRPTGSVATDQLLVTELNSHGVRFSAEQTINTGLTPVTYPRVAPNPLAPRWQTVFSKGNNQGARYQGTADVVLITGTTNGGPPGEYPSGKPPAPGNFRIVVGPSEN